MFHTGQKIGPYTLVKRLGRGGFGEVWLAERHSKFATTQVAVKLPLDEQVDHALIEQEAQLWAKVSGHPNVLPIIEADEYDGQIVIVSEYAPDGSLEQWLKQNSRMTVEKALEITTQILDGLEFLHSRKIIHRDLKPANILLQGTTPRLADFGISRILRTNSYSNAAGTPCYMSPEAFRGKRSIQSDIWSIGIILYQLLTGKLPFCGNHIGEIYVAVTENEPKFSDLRYSKLKENIFKALAKTPENRYKSANEMREDLQNSRLILLEEREKRAKLSQRLKIANENAKEFGITLIKPTFAKKPTEKFEAAVKQLEDEISNAKKKAKRKAEVKKNQQAPQFVPVQNYSNPSPTFNFNDFVTGLIRLAWVIFLGFLIYYGYNHRADILEYINKAAIKIGIKKEEIPLYSMPKNSSVFPSNKFLFPLNSNINNNLSNASGIGNNTNQSNSKFGDLDELRFSSEKTSFAYLFSKEYIAWQEIDAALKKAGFTNITVEVTSEKVILIGLLSKSKKYTVNKIVREKSKGRKIEDKILYY